MYPPVSADGSRSPSYSPFCSAWSYAWKMQTDSYQKFVRGKPQSLHMVRMLTSCNPPVKQTTARPWRISHSSSPAPHGDPDIMLPRVLGMQRQGPTRTQSCRPGHSHAHREPIDRPLYAK